MTSPNKSGSAGFTLIEMMVVLVVLGLALALVTLRGPARSPRLEAEAATRQIAAALRLARARAIAADQPVEFTLDLAGHSFRVGNEAPRLLPPWLGLSALTTAGQRMGGVAGIRFAPDGSASGGRIELVQGSRRAQIGVDWLTGRVSVADAP